VSRDRSLPRALRALAVGWVVLLAANNALPYVGLRDDSCQTMFCDMAWGQDWNTHLFMPQRMASDLWADLEIADVEIAPPPASARLRAVARWLTRPGRLRNTEAVRVVLWQLCRAGHRVALAARRADGDAASVHHQDACAVPALAAPHLWIPVRLYDTDRPMPETP